MILFKKQFKQKILDKIKVTTYRHKFYFKENSIIPTNFVENGKRVKIKILKIEEVSTVNFEEFIQEGFDTKKEMEEYFKIYASENSGLKKIYFELYKES